jgi:hypothetical protein
VAGGAQAAKHDGLLGGRRERRAGNNGVYERAVQEPAALAASGRCAADNASRSSFR